MGSFLLYICDALLSLLSTVIIGNAILSWLVAYDVENLRNRFVSSIADVLDAISRPVLAPFRRFIPPLGGVDITPVIALLVIEAARKTLLPLIFSRLI